MNTDTDGIADNIELMMGTDVLNADEDGDGIPDGTPFDDWMDHPLRAEDVASANLVVSLQAAIPPGASATLVVGDLSLPLRNPVSIPLSLPPGQFIAFRLVSRGGVDIPLSLAPGGVGATIGLDDPNGVFAGSASAGSGRLALTTLSLYAPQGRCVHDNAGGLPFTVDLRPWGWPPVAPLATLDGFSLEPDHSLWLPAPGLSDQTTFGSMSVAPPWLVFGTLAVADSIHLCAGSGTFCLACGRVHDDDVMRSCSHADDCAAKGDIEADCDCAPIFVCVSDVDDPSSPHIVSFVALGDDDTCCCATLSDRTVGVRIDAVSGGLTLFAPNGSPLPAGGTTGGVVLVRADSASPSIGGFSIRYTVKNADGTDYRTLTRRFTAASALVLADIDDDGAIDETDAALREFVGVHGAPWRIARRGEPYAVAFRTRCPSGSTPYASLSGNSPVSPLLLHGGDSLAPGESTNAGPFAVRSATRAFGLDTSSGPAAATVSCGVTFEEDHAAIGDSLRVEVVDIDLADHTVRPSDLPLVEYDLSGASEYVEWTLRDAATGSGIDWDSGATYSPPATLPCGDYEVEAHVWDVWEHGAEGTSRTASLRVADIAIEGSAYAVQVGTEARVRVALDSSVSADSAIWSISPSGDGAPLLYASQTGGAGAGTLSGTTEVWVGAGSATGIYTLVATSQAATNIADTASIHAIRFELSHPDMVMRERGPSTNVLHVVSSDGGTADWAISQDAQYQFDYPKAQLSSVEGGSGKTVSNSARVWITPGVSNVQYTVTATHHAWTNITASADLKVCQIRLEPITPDNYGGTNYNPCAIANERPGRFKIIVEPQSFVPDADIEWVASPLLTSLFDDCHSGTGRVVNVLPIGLGTTRTLQVDIKNFIGPPPEITYEAVGSVTTIPVKVYVAKNSSGNPVVPTAQINSFVKSKIDGVNDIYHQAGVKFTIDYPVQLLPASLGSSFDIGTQQNEIEAVLAFTPDYVGVKVYVVDNFHNGTNVLDAAYTAMATENGITVSYGTMIPAFMEPIIWAHEFGHVCGLDDIYHDVNSTPMYSGPYITPQTQILTAADVPDDYSAYEEPSLRRSDVIPRLLMYGYPRNEQERLGHTDLPIGCIRGLTENDSGSFVEQLVAVGSSSLNKTPSCRQR